MKLLILDNYDSFTYNLVHLVEKVSSIKCDVFLNDKITVEEVNQYDKILLSPGPGIPSQAGIMPELLAEYKTKKSILGICLGLQAIAEAFQSPLKNLKQVYHGLSLPITITQSDSLFSNCPKRFNVGRYHSWVVDELHVHEDLIVTAVDDNQLIMAAKHRIYDVKGVQFHPESILSEHGESIIQNWLNAP